MAAMEGNPAIALRQILGDPLSGLFPTGTILPGDPFTPVVPSDPITTNLIPTTDPPTTVLHTTAILSTIVPSLSITIPPAVSSTIPTLSTTPILSTSHTTTSTLSTSVTTPSTTTTSTTPLQTSSPTLATTTTITPSAVWTTSSAVPAVSNNAPKSFLENKPLSITIFVVAGLVGLILLIILASWATRKNRRNRLLSDAVSFDPNSTNLYDDMVEKGNSLDNLNPIGSTSSGHGHGVVGGYVPPSMSSGAAYNQRGFHGAGQSAARGYGHYPDQQPGYQTTSNEQYQAYAGYPMRSTTPSFPQMKAAMPNYGRDALGPAAPSGAGYSGYEQHASAAGRSQDYYSSNRQG